MIDCALFARAQSCDGAWLANGAARPGGAFAASLLRAVCSIDARLWLESDCVAECAAETTSSSASNNSSSSTTAMCEAALRVATSLVQRICAASNASLPHTIRLCCSALQVISVFFFKKKNKPSIVVVFLLNRLEYCATHSRRDRLRATTERCCLACCSAACCARCATRSLNTLPRCSNGSSSQARLRRRCWRSASLATRSVAAQRSTSCRCDCLRASRHRRHRRCVVARAPSFASRRCRRRRRPHRTLHRAPTSIAFCARRSATQSDTSRCSRCTTSSRRLARCATSNRLARWPNSSQRRSIGDTRSRYRRRFYSR